VGGKSERTGPQHQAGSIRRTGTPSGGAGLPVCGPTLRA